MEHTTSQSYQQRYRQDHRGALRTYNRRYKAEHPEQVATYYRTRLARLRAQTKVRRARWGRDEPHYCLACGTPITRPPRNGVQFYCSDPCRRRGYKLGLRPKIGHQAEHSCATCGRLFFSCMVFTRYCSVDCWERDPVGMSERSAQKRVYYAAKRKKNKRERRQQRAVAAVQNIISRWQQASAVQPASPER